MLRGDVHLLGQLGLGEDISGLLTAGGVDVEVLEEDLRVAGVWSAALVVVGALDVDCRSDRGVQAIGQMGRRQSGHGKCGRSSRGQTSTACRFRQR